MDQQPISKDRVNGERGIDERDDAALYDSCPGRRRGNIVEPAEHSGVLRPTPTTPRRRAAAFQAAAAPWVSKWFLKNM